MMTAMKIRHQLRYDAPPAEVYAMLVDPAFRAAVCESMHVVSQDISVQPTSAGVDLRIDMQQPTEGLPGFARKIVGDRTRVVQSESWQAERGADLEVQIPGKPGHIRGRTTLSVDGSGTVETFEGTATINIPFVGGKIEGLIERLFIAGMDNEREVGTRWLAGDRA
jgi:hypothetical protein